ncbi:limbin isoform X2 [Chanodichthys erythropterus]|uniref:limbin isoform X2 n=1 Tax=Chanodichthys erythropterus TaxID=933992 RepID=UPI00351EFC50
MDGWIDGWFVIMNALIFIARAEDAARSRARTHNRSTAARSDIDRSNHHVEKIQRKKEMRRSISSSEQYTDDVISGQWADQRTTSNASHRSAAKSSVFGVSFLKCAQVDSGSGTPQVRVTLVVRNPEGGRDLSQLCIRDSVSDVILQQTNGSVQERGYQTFSKDTLPAGSQYEFSYRMSVRENRKQNDIHLFGPVVANFTLRVNTTEQVGVDHSLLFLFFLGSFLLTLLLASLSVVSVKLLRRRRLLSCTAHTRSSVNEEAGPYEGACDITASANEEAAFEDKFVDVLMLEDPQNMMQALDSLNVSTLSRAAVALERVRVQMFKGLVSVLLAGVGAAARLSVRAERRVLGVVHGQIVGMEGKVQEEHVARMAALAARCNLETQEEMESLRHKHMSEAAHAERLLQRQDAPDLRALLEELHKQEQKRLQKRLQVRHEHASAQAQRQQALRRRTELHKILGEELEEAVRTGELEKTTASKLLLQYYSCQDALEEGLDVLLANQRALLAERHVQRCFLAQSLQSLQAVTSDAFSSSAGRIRDARAHGECSDVQLEILHVKQNLEETVCRERSAIRCDIIKRRRQLLSEKVCEHRRQLQAVCGSSDITVNQYLQKWTELLMYQNNELSELINHLDEETAARTRKVSLCVLQASLAELKASSPGSARLLPQTEAIQERLQRRGKAAARELRSAQSRVRQQQRQELQDQRSIRDAFREYCSALCVCQRSLSHEQRLCLQLECVNAACRLDRCLVLHHAICELERLGSDASDPAVTLSDPTVTPAGSETERSSEVTELQCFQRRLQERLRPQHSDTQNDARQREACVFQEEQLRVCQERVAVFVASLQWEHAEKKAKVTETHTALLKLQTLVTAELHTSDATHAIHTHRLALEEAELRLQQEAVMWEESAEGRGCCSDDDDDDEEDMFTVKADSGVSVLLQEALFKREQLQRSTDRVLRRNQTLEHQKERLQLKRLQTYCEQDLAFTAALVKQALMAVPDLHMVLRLLLPTVPEGELLSLIDALGPVAGGGSGCCASLADGLKHEVLSRNLSQSPQHRDRERDRDRFLKKRQKLLDKLLSGAGGSEDIHETRRRRRRVRDLPVPEPSSLQPTEETEAGRMIRDDNEGAWPVGVSQDSLVSTRDGNEGAWPVGVSQDSLVSTRDGNEGAWPVGVAQDSLVSTRDGDEGAWPVGVAQDSLVSRREGNEGAWPVGVAQDSLVSTREGNEGAWPVGVAQDSLVSTRDGNEGAWPVGVAQDSLVSSERLFVFRCAPPTAQQQTQNSRSRKKKRNFLNFKKASVAPQQHT